MALLMSEDFDGALGVTLEDNASLVPGRDGYGAGLGFAASPFAGQIEIPIESDVLTVGNYARVDLVDPSWPGSVLLTRVTADDGDARIDVSYDPPVLSLGFGAGLIGDGVDEVTVDLTDRFHFIETRAQVADSGRVSVRVDGAEVLWFEGDTTGGQATTYESVRLAGNLRFRVTYDDLYLADDLTFRGAPLWSLPSSYDTCGDLIGSLDGCRLHLNAGEFYCNRCHAAWLATRGKLIDSSTKIAAASRSVRDDVGVLPPIPLRKGA